MCKHFTIELSRDNGSNWSEFYPMMEDKSKTYEREGYRFTESMSGSMTFVGNEARSIIADPRGQVYLIRFTDEINTSANPYFIGKFKKIECDIDELNSIVVVSAEWFDEAARLNDQRDTEVDLIDLGVTNSTATMKVNEVLQVYELGSNVITNITRGESWVSEVQQSVFGENAVLQLQEMGFGQWTPGANIVNDRRYSQAFVTGDDSSVGGHYWNRVTNTRYIPGIGFAVVKDDATKAVVQAIANRDNSPYGVNCVVNINEDLLDDFTNFGKAFTLGGQAATFRGVRYSTSSQAYEAYFFCQVLPANQGTLSGQGVSIAYYNMTTVNESNKFYYRVAIMNNDGLGTGFEYLSKTYNLDEDDIAIEHRCAVQLNEVGGNRVCAVQYKRIFTRVISNFEDRAEDAEWMERIEEDLITTRYRYVKPVTSVEVKPYAGVVANQLDKFRYQFNSEDAANNPSMRFVEPSESGGQEWIAIADNDWRQVSWWVNRNGVVLGWYDINNPYGFTFENVVKKVLASLHIDLTFEADEDHSEFLYRASNPISGRTNWRWLLFQKSNVLIDTIDEPARKQIIKWSDIERLLKAHACEWFVQDGKLRIENHRWFYRGGNYSTDVIGLDLTKNSSRVGKSWAISKNWSFAGREVTEKLTYGWMDDVSRTFEGVDLENQDNNKDEGTTESYEANTITTDIDFVLFESDKIQKDGWVVMAVNGSGRVVDTLLPVGLVHNGSLSGYFLNGLKESDMPGQVFTQVVGTKSFIRLHRVREAQNVVPGYVVDPYQLVRGTLGLGEIRKVVEDRTAKSSDITAWYND